MDIWMGGLGISCCVESLQHTHDSAVDGARSPGSRDLKPVWTFAFAFFKNHGFDIFCNLYGLLYSGLLLCLYTPGFLHCMYWYLVPYTTARLNFYRYLVRIHYYVLRTYIEQDTGLKYVIVHPLHTSTRITTTSICARVLRRLVLENISSADERHIEKDR